MENDPQVSFLLNVVSTIVGGVVLAVLFFVARERIFPMPSIVGRWHVQMRTEYTDYNPYNEMVLRYVAVLWREGSEIRGTIEKVYENSSTGERKYTGKDRTRGLIEGYIDKRYLSKDCIYVHIVEDGHGRESTHYHDLKVTRRGKMTGRFFAMVANSEGEVTWQRNSFWK